MSRRAGRVLAVLGGVTAAGAVVGAAAGVATAAVVLAVVSLRQIGSLTDLDLEIYRFAATLGAGCGVVLAPAASFAFLRRVPLGRLFAETWLGTVVAGSLGLFAFDSMPAMLAAGAAGFLAAGARLAWVHRARPELEGGEVEPALLSAGPEA